MPAKRKATNSKSHKASSETTGQKVAGKLSNESKLKSGNVSTQDLTSQKSVDRDNSPKSHEPEKKTAKRAAPKKASSSKKSNKTVGPNHEPNDENVTDKIEPVPDQAISGGSDLIYTFDEVTDPAPQNQDGRDHPQTDTPKNDVKYNHTPGHLDVNTYDDVIQKFGDLPFDDLRRGTQQSIFFERITTRGRKPQSINAEEFLDEKQIKDVLQRKLTYKDMSMLPADAVFPHVVIVNLGAIAFFTDLDMRLEIAVDANEKRLNRAMNNPHSPLYKQSISFDSSLRNSPYDLPILSHPSAYFVCVVPSHQFSYASRSGQSAIGKGRSFFRMIRKRCIEIITINLGEGIDQTSEPVVHGIEDKMSVAQSCSFVDIPPYYIEKTIKDEEKSGFFVKLDSKVKFEEYLRKYGNFQEKAKKEEDSAVNEKSTDTLVQPKTVEDAILRLALYYHATLDKRIPITIVSQSENISLSHNISNSSNFPLVETIQSICPDRRIASVPARRKEWIDILSEELQRNCKLRRELTPDDILCLCESPLLRTERPEAQDTSAETAHKFMGHNSAKSETSVQEANGTKSSTGDSPIPEDNLLEKSSSNLSNPISVLLKSENPCLSREADDENPISSLFT